MYYIVIRGWAPFPREWGGSIYRFDVERFASDAAIYATPSALLPDLHHGGGAIGPGCAPVTLV